MEEMSDLADMRHTIMERIQKMMSICCDYRSSFDHYSYLYVDDKKEFMRHFLMYSHVLTAEEIEAHAEDGVPETPPTLEQFKEQIDSYEKIYEEVSHLEPISIFDGWMKVDSRPLKASLLGIIKKWSFMFKQHLIDHVTHRYYCFLLTNFNGPNSYVRQVYDPKLGFEYDTQLLWLQSSLPFIEPLAA